jgi:hypothetical protein
MIEFVASGFMSINRAIENGGSLTEGYDRAGVQFFPSLFPADFEFLGVVGERDACCAFQHGMRRFSDSQEGKSMSVIWQQFTSKV